MTDIMLKDIDDVLLEQGLYAVEGGGRLSFDTSESDVLQAAIDALEGVPDGVFSMIGQLPEATPGDRDD